MVTADRSQGSEGTEGRACDPRLCKILLHIVMRWIVIMRHGVRADKEGESWPEALERPWDAPLSARAAGPSLQRSLAAIRRLCTAGAAPCVQQPAHPARQTTIKVFCSPYIRCLQTVAYMQRALPPWCAADVCIRRDLSEVFDLNILKYAGILRLGFLYSNMKDWLFRSLASGKVCGSVEQQCARSNVTPSGIEGTFPDADRWVKGVCDNLPYRVRPFVAALRTSAIEHDVTVVCTHKAVCGQLAQLLCPGYPFAPLDVGQCHIFRVVT